jgi:hypothetical protein
MKSLIYLHLLVVVMAVICLWSLRHELVERPVSGLGFAWPAVLAILVAAALLIVSPGKRFELWVIAIVLGLFIGLGMGVILTAVKDYERRVVKVQRTWDGFGAAALLLLLAFARLVTSDLMTRQSSKFGILGASASFLAAYICGRAITIWFYTAPRTIHLDMTEDGRRKAG